jgi:hypothetical protein
MKAIRGLVEKRVMGALLRPSPSISASAIISRASSSVGRSPVA